MGASHSSPAEKYTIGKDGQPVWNYTTGTHTKSKFDFPRAKEGGPETLDFVVGDRHPGKPKRLDKYLQERFPGYSRSFLQKMIKDGMVLINGHTVKSSWHATMGEKVTMKLHKAGPKIAEDIPFQVLFEDAQILVLVKPAGVLVHPARGHKSGTLYNGLLHYYREQRATDPSFHIGTIHRLDEQTSGVMVYARCAKAHGEMTRQFENRLVKKAYLCVVHGDAQFEEETIDRNIGVDPENRYRNICDGLDPQTASTRFVKLGRSACGQFSLLRAHPFTGRTHQIRVHAAGLGLPLIGDVLYGGLKEHPAFEDWAVRVALHAESLAIHHPATQEPMFLRAPLPADFARILEILQIPQP